MDWAPRPQPPLRDLHAWDELECGCVKSQHCQYGGQYSGLVAELVVVVLREVRERQI